MPNANFQYKLTFCFQAMKGTTIEDLGQVPLSKNSFQGCFMSGSVSHFNKQIEPCTCERFQACIIKCTSDQNFVLSECTGSV